MKRSWGTAGMLLWTVSVMGVGLSGCGVAGADGLVGDQPLAVVPQASGDAPAWADAVAPDRPAVRDELITAQEQPSPSDEDADVDGADERGAGDCPLGFESRHGRRGGPGWMHGGPAGGGPGARAVGMLDLTDEQRQQARDIRLQMREDVKALRDAARDEIHGLLTEEQLAELEELRADRPRFGGRHRGGHGPGPHRFVGPPADRQRPIDTLDLTEEQQIAIDAIRAKLHEDVQALHDAAREAFRAILTPEQIDILDQLHNPAEENVAQPAPATDG